MYLDLIDRLTPSWHARAACHPETGQDPERWFPVTREGGREARQRSWEESVDTAIKICRACPVKQQCLDAAIDNGEKSGIWGGRNFDSDAARRALRGAA